MNLPQRTASCVSGLENGVTMEKVTIFGVPVVGWIGFVATLFTWAIEHVGALVTLMTGILAMVVTFYGLKIQRQTLRNKQQENLNQAIDMAQKERNLCDQCLTGRIPSHCPVPEDDRPPHCPLREKKDE